MFNRGKLGFSQKIENVQESLEIFVHTNDKRSISQKRRTGVILTPEVEAAYVTIVPPAYTGHKERKRDYNWKNLTLIQGSKVSFSLQSNRPLSGGHINLVSGEKKSSIKLTPSGEKEVSGSFIAQNNSRLRFKVIDVDQLESRKLLKGNISIRKDLPPTIQIISPENDSYVN